MGSAIPRRWPTLLLLLWLVGCTAPPSPAAGTTPVAVAPPPTLAPTVAPTPEPTPVPRRLTLAVDGFADNEAMNGLLVVLLKDRLGYDVQTRPAAPADAYAGVARGDIDLYASAYLPRFHQELWARHGDKIDRLGPVHEGFRTGLAVPAYVAEVSSIDDLRRFGPRFGENIFGNQPTATNMALARQAIKSYNLNFDLVEASEPAQLARLQKAIEGQEWIVVTAFSPHWAWARWQLKWLADSQKVFPDPDGLYLLARQGLATIHPEPSGLLNRLKLTPQQHASLMLAIAEGATPVDAARKLLGAERPGG